MQLRYLPALVMLIAGCVGCVFSIVKSYDLLFTMKMELIVMIIFFIIGTLAKKIISKILSEENHTQTDSLNDVDGSNENINSKEE